MQMLIAGDWVDAAETIAVNNPFDNSTVDTVPKATPDDIERAMAFAAEGARKLRKVPGHDRYLG